MPRFSILLCTFNSQYLVERTLQSLVNQEFQNFEVVVQDGGSTDRTIEIVESYCSILSINIMSVQDNGIYDALNRAIQRAKGEYCIHLHSDDFLFSLKTLKNVDSQLKGNTDILSCGIKLVDKRQNLKEIWHGSNLDLISVLFGKLPPHTGLIVRRSLFQDCFNYDTKFRISSDFKWLLQLCECGLNVDVSPEILSYMTVGGASSNRLAALKEDFQTARQVSLKYLLTVIMKRLRKIRRLFTGFYA